ncbi:MAG: hypothetical protein NT105_23920 [Verrucomicrobia bacterium]|nr:hypothetical protein [Verrucomicrobiota bacterium]
MKSGRGGLVVGIACFALVASSWAADAPKNILKNGDFSQNKMHWQGGGRIVSLEDAPTNKALRIKLNKHEPVKFSCAFEAKNAQGVKLKFRVRTSADFSSSSSKLGAFTIKFHRPNGGYRYSDRVVKQDPQWQVMTWTCSEVSEGGMKLEIDVKPGKGELTFDDFVLEPVEG